MSEAGTAATMGLRSARMSQLMWRVNRLRCMSPAEIGHRVVRLLQIHGEKLRSRATGLHAAPAADLSLAPKAWLRLPPGLDSAPYLAAAERLVAGRFDVFALEDMDLGSPPNWNRDPRTGLEAPLAFGKLLDYRDPAVVGDIKYLWEPNRHLHLVTLAQAWALSGEQRYVDTLRSHVESWIDACPYPLGANWSSALEPGMRLINWSLAWQLLGGAQSPLFAGSDGERFRDRWLESVYQHAEYVHGHFSLYSSANNHLVGEASGLYLAALTWPLWARARSWKQASRTVLEREALLQNAADGVNREQAVSYQQWELDLLLLPMLAAEAAGQPFPPAYRQRIEAMLEYLASIMDAGGNLPMFGDADDGYVARLSQQPGFCRYRSLLATGALLFGRGDFKAKAAMPGNKPDDKTRWLLGPASDGDYATLVARPEALPVRRAFPEGGYYILGCDFESPREIRLVADAGPLGYQAIAAHGHADALSFTLSVGGREFLVDPGTYAYHTQGAWRQYFRGTSAHNTLRIDGQDQSVPGGNFMWLQKASAGCRTWASSDETDEFDGWHDGYMRLADPVMHERHILLRKAERLVVIEDRLQSSEHHDAELFFHCAEDCAVSEQDGGYRIVRDGGGIHLRLPQLEGAQTQVLRGSTEPIGGWVSRRFDVKQPAATIVWRARFCGALILRTCIRC